MLPDKLHRNRTVLTVLFACALVVGGGMSVVEASPPAVTVSSVSVSDDEPETGDSITVTPTVRLSGEGSGTFEVTEVTLEDASGTQYSEADSLGTLGAGDTIDVPLSATFDTAGRTKLLVHVRGMQYDADGNRLGVVTTMHPTYVTVSEPSTETETPPQLNVDTEDLVAGSESTVTVTVSNGDDEQVTDLSLRLSGLGENQTRIQPELGAHNSTTFTFDVTPPEAGTHSLDATLTHADGSVSTNESVTVQSLNGEAVVHATTVTENGSTDLRYHVANHGNAPIENVVVSGAAVGTALPTTVIQSVEPGTTETATVELNERPTGPATISATYDVGSTTGSTDQSVRFANETADAESASQATTETPGSGTAPATFGAVPLLTGGVVAAGSIIGYRSWRGRFDR
ncbi:Uncharacterized conserved protein [Haloplanus vescus]|uniref:Uncharacterized conserved protein n=2 Tax=Haloplanus vescus TaxID=555874 RepID=A0A1H3VP93_9EURY|nr:Uncharacterized conserved protein [Haloplanus vescus]